MGKQITFERYTQRNEARMAITRLLVTAIFDYTRNFSFVLNIQKITSRHLKLNEEFLYDEIKDANTYTHTHNEQKE